MTRGRRGAAALVIAAALLAACSFDYSESGAGAEELLETVPETELRDVIHTVVRNGRVVAEISADQVQNFPRRRYALLDEVRYVEYDAAGNPVTTGSAEHAVFYSEREDATVAGTIRLRSESQGVRLEAESLRWEGARHRLVSEQMVEISRGRRFTGARRGLCCGRAPQGDSVHGARHRHTRDGQRRGVACARGRTALPRAGSPAV